MPRFAANLTLLWPELPFLDRFQAAADAGFKAVEILFPYDIAAKDIQRALLTHDLQLILMNAPPPNYTGGVRGFAALPDGEARFQHDIKRALRYAEVLNTDMLHVMSGAAAGTIAFETFVRNLQWAADYAPQQRFNVEPLNTGDQPGYFMCDYDLAVEVLDAVNRPNVGLQYDTYHAHMIHGDAHDIWAKHGYRATHVQIGNPPDRSDPVQGPVDFSALFAQLDADGYNGWISAEYNPKGRTEDGLGWMLT